MESVFKKNEYKWINRYRFSILISFIALSLLYLVLGIYWEESMKIPPAIIYSQICSPPYDAWFNESFFFQPPIIAYLSSCFSAVPVLGIWHFILLVFYTSITLHLALRIISRIVPASDLFTLILGILITFCVLSSSLIYIHLGREALLLSAMSALLYIDYYYKGNQKPRFFIFTFFLGCLMRVSLGIFVLVGISTLLWLYSRSLRKAFVLLFWQWLIAILCFAIVLIYKFNVNNPGVIIEQNYEYALMDRGAVHPLSSMKTNLDSLRYEALTHFFLITDSQQISIPFIQKVIDGPKFYKFGFNTDDYIHLQETLFPLLTTNSTTIFFLYMLLLVIGWGCGRRTAITILLFNLFCWAVIGLLSMKISMYERFLLPLIAMAFMGSLLLISFQKKHLRSGRKFSLFALLIVFCITVTKQLKSISTSEKEYNQKAYSYLKQLDQLSKSSTPVIWDYTQCYFPSHLLSREEGNALKGSLYQTMFFIAYFPFGQERYIQKTGASPLNFKAFGEVLLKDKSQFSFVMEERTSIFITKYYKTIYGLDLTFVCDSPRQEFVPNNFVFRLKP